MDTKHFSLDTRENSKIINIIRIVFGIVCVITAIFWTWFNFNAVRSQGTIWITILFLAGFGVYQVFTGFGHTSKYIDISKHNLIIRNRSVLRPYSIPADEIEKIDFFPLNVVFFLKSKKRILIRFGTTYHETNEKIVAELSSFAERNNITAEVIEEKL